MHRIVYVCVAWLYDSIMTSEHARMASVSCFRAIFRAVHVAWVSFQRAMEHEALEALSLVLAVCLSIARRLGRSFTLVERKLRCTCEHDVLWVKEGLEVRTSTVG